MSLSSVPFFKVDTFAELEFADRQMIVLVLESERVCYFDTVTEEWKTIVVANQQAYPVGSIFLSAAATDPTTLLGYGTWVSIGAGKMLVGFDSGDADFDTLEETGGAKTVTLTEAQMPSHTHIQNSHQHVITSQTATTGSATSYEHGVLDTSSAEAEATETTQAATATNQNTGGGTAHNNLPPYLVVNMWKRTA